MRRDRVAGVFVAAYTIWAVSFCGAAPAAVQNVGWRGDGSGQYPSATPPTTWSSNKNIIWSTPMPAAGNSSPIIVGKKIFVCAEPATLICCNLADGKILWQRTNTFEDCVSPDDKAVVPGLCKLQYADAGYSTPTPVSDGAFVYIHSAIRIVACYDLEGNRKWARVTEQIPDGRGHSTTPILVGDRLFVQVRDLVAYDKKNGKEMSRTKTQHGWGSLASAKIGDVAVVITPKGAIVNAADGTVLGSAGTSVEFATPVVSSSLVYFIGKDGGIIRLPATVEKPLKVEKVCGITTPSGLHFASPVILDGLAYSTAQKGWGVKETQLTVFDTATGALVYEKDLAFVPGKANYSYPSVTLAGKHVFVSNESGQTVVIAPGKEYKELARNALGEGFRGCPVFQSNRMYIRGVQKLYCIGQ